MKGLANFAWFAFLNIISLIAQLSFALASSTLLINTASLPLSKDCCTTPFVVGLYFADDTLSIALISG